MNKLLGLFSAVLLFTMFSSGAAKAAKDCGSKDPIIIPLHNWTSQIVMSRVVGLLFEEIDCQLKMLMNLRCSI